MGAIKADELFFFFDDEVDKYFREKKKPNITIDNYQYFSLDELKDIDDKELREIALQEYYKVLDSVSPKMHIKPNASIIDIIENINDYERKHISQNNNHLIFVYNKRNCRHVTTKERVCAFCQEKIYVGQAYIIWRPMFYDKTGKLTKVFDKDLILKEECWHYLPRNIGEFEMMENNLSYCSNHSYNTNIDFSNWFPNNHHANGNHIDYEELSGNVGSSFSTMILKKKKNTTLK